MRYYLDCNGNSQRDFGEDYIDSAEFFVQLPKVYTLDVATSAALIPAPSRTTIQADFTSSADTALRRDAADDWRACIQLVVGTISTTNGPDPVQNQTDVASYWSESQNVTLVDDFVNARGEAKGIPCDPPQFIVDWIDKWPETIVHEFGHCRSLQHYDSDTYNIMCSGPIRTQGANKLTQGQAAAYDTD